MVRGTGESKRFRVKLSKALFPTGMAVPRDGIFQPHWTPMMDSIYLATLLAYNQLRLQIITSSNFAYNMSVCAASV